MGDDTEWIKLPTDEKVVHKAWKARVAGYEEAIKLFRTLDEKSPEFMKYLGSLKKIAVDNNAIAQEKGLDTILAFVENANCAGKACSEVVGALVAKCLNATRAKTKETALEIIMMYIEIDKPEPVQEELIKGLENKQPKIVYGCIQALCMALESFGPKVIQLKPLVKVLPALLEDRDKTVRDEAKALVVQIYRWIGQALKPQLANLKPVQLQELEQEFEKLPAQKAQQTRFMRSQQDLKAKHEAGPIASGGQGDGGGEEAAESAEIDPMDLIDPVEILTKLPKNFYEQIEAKKWQERKEMLEAVDKLATENPKLLPGDYSELLKSLKKVVSKDTNVMLVALAAHCLFGIANGLRKKFQPYATLCIEAILEKFKEKKPMVVTALREAIDAIYVSISLEPITEIVLPALADKNPAVKAETALFLARCFSKATPTSLNKKVLKPYVEPLVKTMNDTAPEVREASFDALGTAMKVVGEKVITAFMGEIDPLKMTKIKESCEKAVLINMKIKSAPAAPAQSAPSAAKPVSRPGTAPAKTGGSDPIPKATAAAAGGERPATSGGTTAGKKPAGKPAGKATGGGKPGGKPGAPVADSKPAESLLSDELVEEKAKAMFGEENLTNLASSNWKERLAAIESIEQEIKRTAKEDMPTQAVTRTIGVRKPGLKDTNFQVLKIRLSALTYLAENFNFSSTSCDCVLGDVVDKLGDAKNGQGAKDLLTAISESTQFPKVANDVVKIAFDGKNPKAQAEALNWLAQAILDFGFKVNIKPLIASLKLALAATNPSVRQSAITLLGVCYMYMGATLRTLFEDEKPALLQQIDAEFEKMKGQKPPAPVRGVKAVAGEGGEEEDQADQEGAVEDLVPRNDISEKITESLLEKLGDKNWKIRKEGLDEVTAILNDAKFVTANLGGLPEALKHRLSDSNKLLVTSAIGILKTIASASGPQCRKHVPILAGALISTMGDSKPQIRQSACAALDAWIEQTKLAPFVEDGIFAEAIKVENPNLRSTFLGWLSLQLKENPKKLPPELKDCLVPLFSCLGDRNPDVRKSAQDAILPFMMHCGFDSMLKAAAKLDKLTKDGVVTLLEKARTELPATKPIVKVQSAPIMAHITPDDADEISAPTDELPDGEPSGKSAAGPAKLGSAAPKGDAAKSKGTAGKAKAAPVAAPISGAGKKAAEEDMGPIMTNTYTKQMRMKDEKNLKTLKWNFTAPRQEFVDQLREQMEKNFSKSVMDHLFSTDFQKHTKAIQMLVTAVETHRAETIANVDLVLRWFTLRFFETNPSMLNKALEYLQQLFEMLSAENYALSDSEASAFVPYLILKVGEAKDNVRRDVRKIMNAICCTYPVSKMFMFIMGGLASKNSKQRAECLEELGCLMERHGLDICQPSPKDAIKEIAKQIADRDNPVRTAALNTIVVAYNIIGEQVYKYVGKLNDKDLGMLEERIKRSSKGKTVAPPAPATATLKAPSTPKQRPGSSGAPGDGEPVPSVPPTVRKDPVGLIRPNATGGLSHKPLSSLPAEFCIDVDFKVNIENNLDLERLDPSVDAILNQSVQLPVTKSRRAPSPSSKLLQSSNNASTAIDLTVTNVASSDPVVALHSLNQIELELGERDSLLTSRIDQILIMSALQLKLIHTKHLADDSVAKDTVFRLHRVLQTVMLKASERKLISKTATDIFKDLFSQLISAALDQRLNDYAEGQELVKSINMLIVNILQSGNQSNTLCAALSLLYDCVSPTAQCSEQFTDLVLKCIWKKTRLLEGTISQMLIEPVLQVCHVFLSAYPSATWSNRPSDKPLRTVKTVIAVMLQHASDKVTAALPKLDFGPKSELEMYIKKHLAKQGLKSISNGTTSSTESLNARNGNASSEPPSPKMTKYIHDSLAEIFKKIGSKENSKEGLLDLYNFKERYPEASLEPFLKKSSPFFQTYIQRGLQSIENEKKSGLSKQTNSQTADVSTNECDAEVQMRRERLIKIRERMNRPGSSSSTGSHGSQSSPPVSLPKPDVVLSNRPQPVLDESPVNKATVGTASASSSSSTHSELMDLKARLERIKKGQL